jgi:hypothetical protein
MLKKLISLFLGNFCGIALLILISIPKPFSMEALFVSFVLNPVKFFLVMIVFMVGFICFSHLIKGLIEQTYNLLTRKDTQAIELLLCSSVLMSFFLLFLVSFWQTFFLFLFSTVYGLFSVEVSKKTKYEVNG